MLIVAAIVFAIIFFAWIGVSWVGFKQKLAAYDGSQTGGD